MTNLGRGLECLFQRLSCLAVLAAEGSSRVRASPAANRPRAVSCGCQETPSEREGKDFLPDEVAGIGWRRLEVVQHVVKNLGLGVLCFDLDLVFFRSVFLRPVHASDPLFATCSSDLPLSQRLTYSMLAM